MLRALLKTMRPRQWPKNAVVFAALVFDVKLFNPAYLGLTVAAFALLCLLSSSVYIINDLVDIEKDRQHPTKRFRPLAAGALPKSAAAAAAVLFLAAAIGGSFVLTAPFGALALLYLIVNLLYSFWLKHIVILDVLLISAGFLIRVGAGTVLFPVERFSPWLYVGMGLLSLFLILGKRRHEIVLLQHGADNHRAVLANYNLDLLDHMIGIVTTAAIIAYSFYTFSAENLPRNHTMMLTVPFVFYGIFRYLYLIHVKQEGGAPDELAFKDRPLLVTVALWGVAVVAILYFLK